MPFQLCRVLPLRQESSPAPALSQARLSAVSVLNAGFGRNVCAAALTARCSEGVYALSACCTLLLSCARTVSGTSEGDWVMKYTPTPFERMSFITCSILSTRAVGAPLNSRWASSKKNTSLGFSRSPTSGQRLEQLAQQPQHEGRVKQRGMVTA